jgi:uncharacterized protein YegP (UPF0339 family)
MKMGKFTILRGKNMGFYFNLKASNGLIILQSEGYTSKQNCINGIASVRQASVYDLSYKRNQNDAGHYYFNLCALNGQVIGRSQMYTSKQALETGVSSVKENAGRAIIDDQTN